MLAAVSTTFSTTIVGTTEPVPAVTFSSAPLDSLVNAPWVSDAEDERVQVGGEIAEADTVRRIVIRVLLLVKLYGPLDNKGAASALLDGPLPFVFVRRPAYADALPAVLVVWLQHQPFPVLAMNGIRSICWPLKVV